MGIYNHFDGSDPKLPGAEAFQGSIVKPQFWPEKLDYTDKKVVIVGIGATAATILPSMSAKASRVTMVQRSPSYYAPTAVFTGLAA